MSHRTPSILLVRPLPGTVGERNRTVHLVPMPDTETIPQHLTAHCGQQFAPGTIELLSQPHGMPCERCLAKAQPTTTSLPAGITALEVPNDSANP